MIDRRLVLATLAAALLLAGAIFLPAAVPSEPQEALEPTAVTGPIASAIDAGAAAYLAGSLPTSENYQRVSAAIDGLKAGIPLAPPSLSTAQLDDVKAIAKGVASGTQAGSPNTLTSAADKAALRALATGFFRGALTELGSQPSAGRAAVDEAIAKGVFTGAASLFLGEDPVLSTSDHESFGQTLSTKAFDELDRNAGLFVASVGSPALADITLLTSQMVQDQLGSIPAGVARAQLDAVATFGAGTLDGIAVGLVTGFPQGLPLPAKTDLQRYFEGIATGHEGTPPWQRPASLDLLFAWADAVAASGIAAVDDARATLTSTSPESKLQEIGAWGRGLAEGGFTRLDAVATSAPQAEQDVRDYAEGLTGPAIEAILTRPHPAADPDAVEAWANGLTGALEEVGQGSGAGGYLVSYLAPLAEAATTFPSTSQTALLTNFAEGVTNALTLRLGNVSSVAASEDDPALLEAMARGLAEGAATMLGGPSPTDPNLAEAFGDGLASGFLDSKDPEAIWGDVDTLLFATEEWFASSPPVSVETLYQTGVGAVRDPYNAVFEYGRTMGGAPVEWASNKGAGLDVEAWGSKDDAVWIGGFAQETAALLGASLLAPEGGLNEAAVQETQDALNFYVENVTGQLNLIDIKELRQNLTLGQVLPHAMDFADYVLVPLTWLGSPGVGGEKEAAREMLNDTLQNARHFTKFKDAAYAQATIELARAMADGVKQGAKLAREDTGDALPEGGLTGSYVKGVLAAIREIPVSQTRGDLSDRIQWVRHSAAAVPSVAVQATRDQKQATTAFAKDVTAWALGGPGRVPEPGDIETPLLAFLHGAIGEGLGSLPPILTPEEQEAVVAYLDGVTEAATAFPGLDAQNWSLPDIAAIEAYVGGVASGVDVVANETQVYLCAMTNKDALPACESGDDGGGDPTCDDPDGCDPCEEDPNAEGCSPDPEPCLECDLGNYTEALRTWATGLVTPALIDVNVTNPTLAGIQVVTLWATQTLAGHGFCPDFEDPGLECDGPRGPLVESATARHDDLQGFAGSLGEGYGELVGLPTAPEKLLDPLTSPFLAYASGLQNALGVGWLQPDRYLPGDDAQPPGSPVPLPDGASEEALREWTSSLWGAIPERFEDVWIPFPSTAPLDDAVAHAEYIYADVIWTGGAAAIFEASRNGTAIGRDLTPNTGALDAFALGLVGSVNATLVQPAKTDLEFMANWYRGVAEGGVAAIIEAGTTIKEQQIPALRAYAEYLGSAAEPPLPIEKPGQPAPPAPPSPEDVTIPEDEEEEEEVEEEEQPEGPSPTDVYLANLQVHAAGLAEAALAVPTGALQGNVTAFQNSVALYVQSVVAAASALPPASSDTGFPVRLRDWTEAEAAAALALYSPDPSRLGPNPNTAMAQGYVEGFASTIPWNLEQALAGKEGWAASAIAAASALLCPAGNDIATCHDLGVDAGEAVARALPGEIASIPLPNAADRLAYVKAAVEAAAPTLDTPAGPEILLGLLQGLSPEGLGDPNADDVARTAVNAMLPHLAQIPVVNAAGLTRELTEALLTMDASRHEATAKGAVALVGSLAASGADPAAVQKALEAYLAGDGGPSVTASDGTRSGAPTSALVLDGNKPIAISVFPAGSSPLQATWELRWSASDPNADTAQKKAMAGSEGAYLATLTASDLANLARGASVRFVVVETTPAGSKSYGDPFVFIPDRDAPTSTISSKLGTGAQVALTWTGTDADSTVASFRVESRDGEGAWTEWLAASTARSATFTGLAGHSYAFRVTARDLVGHTSAPATAPPVAIPGDAPANKAPTVTFRAPGAGAVFAGDIPVVLETSDPDGTTPSVKVCLRKDRATVDLECLYEGEPGDISLKVGPLSDGRYRLHAIATDGTLTAETLSPTFVLDRSPPTMRGAAADASAAGVIVSASVDEEATNVVVDVAGKTVPLTDDGEGADATSGDGVWTATTSLPPGPHDLTFRAIDANGNEATLTKSIVVPTPAPPKPSGTTTTPTTAPTTAPPAPGDEEGGGKGMPFVGAPLLVLAFALALVLRQRKR